METQPPPASGRHGTPGLDIFKIAGQSISGFLPSFKTGGPDRARQPFTSQLEERLAKYLCEQTGVQVSEETVRVYLHAHDYVCKRPTWTLRRKAAEQAHYVGNASG